jgi:hypothetical protein
VYTLYIHLYLNDESWLSAVVCLSVHTMSYRPHHPPSGVAQYPLRGGTISPQGRHNIPSGAAQYPLRGGGGEQMSLSTIRGCSANIRPQGRQSKYSLSPGAVLQQPPSLCGGITDQATNYRWPEAVKSNHPLLHRDAQLSIPSLQGRHKQPPS